LNTVQEFTHWLLPTSPLLIQQGPIPFFAEVEEQVSLHVEEKKLIGYE
jgi:hypothetical protein